MIIDSGGNEGIRRSFFFTIFVKHLKKRALT